MQHTNVSAIITATSGKRTYSVCTTVDTTSIAHVNCSNRLLRILCRTANDFSTSTLRPITSSYSVVIDELSGRIVRLNLSVSRSFASWSSSPLHSSCRRPLQWYVGGKFYCTTLSSMYIQNCVICHLQDYLGIIVFYLSKMFTALFRGRCEFGYIQRRVHAPHGSPERG